MKSIPVAGPWITEKEIDYVSKAVANAWYGQANVFNEQFELSFANYIGSKFAVTLPSCTAAIHLSLLALNVKPGDEVIVPDATWIATAAPINYVSAVPVFADVDSKTWCMDARSLEENITEKTRAVIPVDLYGNMPDMDTIVDVAKKHNIAIIEDAAEAIGSSYRGKKAGSIGDIGVFSFHGSKTLTTGEGGMLVTNDESIYERVLFLRDHGRQSGDRMFWNTEVAYKYKMSSMQAALGLAQLERIDELLAKKQQIFDWYQEELLGNDLFALNYQAPETRNTYWMVTVLVNPKLGLKKEELMSEMKKRQVNCRPFFYPLSALPAYSHLPSARKAQINNVVSKNLSDYGINLPSALNLTRQQVQYVCRQLQEVASTCMATIAAT